MTRIMWVKRIRSRRGIVRGGEVETVNSIVVGDGRRVVRYGDVVSILLLTMGVTCCYCDMSGRLNLRRCCGGRRVGCVQSSKGSFIDNKSTSSE